VILILNLKSFVNTGPGLDFLIKDVNSVLFHKLADLILNVLLFLQIQLIFFCRFIIN